MRFIVLLMVFIGLAGTSGARCRAKDPVYTNPALLAQLRQKTASQPFSKGVYWEVRKNGKTSWIIGTIHLDDVRVRKVPRFFKTKIRKARVVQVELTPQMASSLKRDRRKNAKKMLRTRGTPFATYFTKQEWSRIAKIAKKKGINQILLHNLTPAAVSGLLDKPLCAYKRKNFLDLNIMRSAIKARVPLQGLDDLQFIRKLKSVRHNDKYYVAKTKLALRDWKNGPSHMEGIVQMYRHGEALMVQEYSLAASRALTQDKAPLRAARRSYDVIIAKRNKIWLPKVVKQLKIGNAVVAVGALHLGGKKGLLYALQRKGFTLKRLDL